MTSDDKQRYYRTLSLVSKREEPIERDESHLIYNRERYTGRLHGTLAARQPLHIGTGLLVPPQTLGLDDAAPLVKAFYRAGDQVVIPGTSLKGAVRHLVEAITYSAVSKVSPRTRRSVNLPDNLYGESRYDSRRRRGELDPAGRLFGAMGYLGHVQFADGRLQEGRTSVMDIPPQYEPTASQGRRYYPHALKDPRQPLWPLEVVEPGGVFAWRIHFENLTEAELGVLLIALGQSDPAICLKIGAGKSSGLGGVMCQNVLAETCDLGYTAWQTTWTPLNISACVTAAQEKLTRRDSLQRLQVDLGCAQLG